MKKNIFYIMLKLFYLEKFPLFIILIVTFLFFFLLPSAFSMLNPSAVYCTALGYDYKDVKTPEGEVGMCVFSNNTNVNAWDFLSGKVALENSYCDKEGYEAKHVVNMEICDNSDECTVCVLKNGTEVEVTKLMGLNFQEGVCGDGFCVIGENYANCPQDCPSGSRDGYCDGKADGICDPDCIPSADSDCITSTTLTTTTTKKTTTTIQVCNKNNKCEPQLGENYNTCPQDCLSVPKTNMTWIYIVLCIAIVALLVFFLTRIKGEKIERRKQIAY
jgi:putative hemolysin